MVGDMTEQGLGQVGGQPQQAQEEFTVDTAGRKNAEIVDKMRADSATNSRAAKASALGLGTVVQVGSSTPQSRAVVPQMEAAVPDVPQGLGVVAPNVQAVQIDQDAITAVRNGQVDPMAVMEDPTVSNDAKAVIQGMMA